MLYLTLLEGDAVALHVDISSVAEEISAVKIVLDEKLSNPLFFFAVTHCPYSHRNKYIQI
jgi:hypothetical protein